MRADPWGIGGVSRAAAARVLRVSGCYSRECGHCGDPWPWPKPLLDRVSVWWWAGPGLAVYSFSYVRKTYPTSHVATRTRDRLVQAQHAARNTGGHQTPVSHGGRLLNFQNGARHEAHTAHHARCAHRNHRNHRNHRRRAETLHDFNFVLRRLPRARERERAGPSRAVNLARAAQGRWRRIP